MARFAPTFFATLIVAGTLAGQDRDDANKSIDRVLAVQNALYQGRQHLLKGEAKQAVAALEAELANSNGNREFLTALRDAYWAYLKDLQRVQKNDEIPIILNRLRKLDPTAKLDGFAAAEPNAITMPEPRKARGKAPDGDPFQQTPIGTTTTGDGDVLRRAEQAFSQERFDDAEQLFEQALAKDLASTPSAAKARWAFCILKSVSDRLNTNVSAHELQTLEVKTHQAISLASGKLELKKYGEKVLDRIRETRGDSTAPTPTPVGDWSVIESMNFRLNHRATQEFAERFLAAAEKTRSAAIEKWFGSTTTSWSLRCDIYLHPSTDEYVRTAKGHPQSQGFTTVEVKGTAISRRRIDLAADNPALVTATLPREVTHVVLADVFHDPLLPRWADEAMAILAEPRVNVDRYLRAVPRLHREGKICAVGSLLTSSDFPEASAITPFYVQSVSLVDMLVGLKGPKAFALYLQDSRRYGYEKALERSYKIKSFHELQDRWERHALVSGE